MVRLVLLRAFVQVAIDGICGQSIVQDVLHIYIYA
jgi:hypothetical protein